MGKCRGSFPGVMVRQDDPQPVQLVTQGLQVWARSVCGQVRPENQDAWCVVTPEDSAWGPASGRGTPRESHPRVEQGAVAAVFDGLGGHPKGRAAARQAAKGLMGLASGAPAHRVLLDSLNSEVRETGGATTAVVAFVSAAEAGSRSLRLVSVGDSAAYVLDGSGRLQRANELDRATRHELTDCLGAGDGIGHEVVLPMGPGVLLVSDGVDGVLPEIQEWGTLLQSGLGTVAATMDRLFKAVERAGAPDNATLVVVRETGF